MNTSALHDAIAAVCPVVWVGVAPDDSVTLGYTPEATDAEKAAAQTVISSWVDPPPLLSVTKRQFMLQCKAAGIWATVKSALASDPEAQDEFDCASEIFSTDAHFNALAKSAPFGFTDAMIAEFFQAASAL